MLKEEEIDEMISGLAEKGYYRYENLVEDEERLDLLNECGGHRLPRSLRPAVWVARPPRVVRLVICHTQPTSAVAQECQVAQGLCVPECSHK